jgi:hypothetical protein
MWPLLTRFRYANDPMGRLPTVPTTPASSNASRAAERWGALPFCGQPFGMIQRRVSRDVTSIAIDDAGARAQPRDGIHDQAKTMGKVAAVAGVEPHPRAVLPGDDPKAVVLDLVHPRVAAFAIALAGIVAGMTIDEWWHRRRQR